MTRVLLIADTERVQRIFHSLKERGVLQLKTVSTLDLGESELADSRYDFTFVQSRISGFSGVILLRHLDKILPEGAQLVLLGGDPDDAAQARKHGRQSIDLLLDDDLLEQTVVALLTGAPVPEPSPFRTRGVAPSPAAAGEPEEVEEPTSPPRAEPPVQNEEPPADKPAPAAPQAAGKAGVSAFEEEMRRASAGVTPLNVQEVEDLVQVGKGASPAPEATTGVGAERREPLPAGSFLTGEPLAEAMRRAEKKYETKKSRRPYLLVVSVLVLIAVPLVSYLVGRRASTDSPTASAPAAPATPPAAPVPAPPAKQAPPSPAVQPQQTPQPSSVAEPRRGLASLPPMLEGTRLDQEYGKTHPGWVRYIGLRAEYKLFKENNLFKAIQVVAGGGGTISEDLFIRVLREFGGIDSYRVESSSRKGDYLIEQCSTPGNTALTIYRSQKTLQVKAFVVYYR